MSSDTLIGIVTTIFMVGFYIYLARRVGKIAHRRGRNVYTWSIIGFLSPIPAMVLVYILPNKAPSDLSVIARQF